MLLPVRGANITGIAPDTYSATSLGPVTVTGTNPATTPAVMTPGVAASVQPATAMVTPPPPQKLRPRTQTREDMESLRKAAQSITVSTGVEGNEVWHQIRTKLLALKFDRPSSFMEIWRLYSEEAAKFTLQGTSRSNDSFNLFLDNTRFYQDAIDLYILNSEEHPEASNLTKEIRRLSLQVQNRFTPDSSLNERRSQTGDHRFDHSVDEVFGGLQEQNQTEVQKAREQKQLEQSYLAAMAQVSKLNAEVNT